MSEIREYLDSVTNGEFSPRQKEFLAQILGDFVLNHYEPNLSDYQIAARRLLSVLYWIDLRMCRTRDPKREWTQIAYIYNLPSKREFNLTQAKIGRQFGLTKRAIVKATVKLMADAQAFAMQ